jgi:predicted translin family RNA/ssDNA-binding protein
MIDTKLFNKLRKQIESYDHLREELIKRARDVLRAAKLTIYSIHRNKNVSTNLTELKKQKRLMESIIKKDPSLHNEGSYSEACQEYTEALTYYHFVKSHKLVLPKDIGVNTNDYLMGVCDLTGELARKAVMCAIENDIKTLLKIYEFTQIIFNEFFKFMS